MSSSLVNDVIPENKETTNGSSTSPDEAQSHEHHFLHNLTLPNRRVRTVSETERIAQGPAFKGKIAEFCRNKGHGFITPDDGSEPLFVHISDIEGVWCPKEGDAVSFKKALMPPRMNKFQAVHVNLVHLKEGIPHEHWDSLQTH